MERAISAEAAPSAAAAQRRRWRSLAWRTLRIAVVCVLIATLVVSESYLGPAYTGLVITRTVGQQGFDLGSWELQAVRQKMGDAFERPGAELTGVEQHDLVVEYFKTVQEVQDLEARVQRVYADRAQSDTRTASAPLQAELDRLRALQRDRRPAVERIIQGQIGEVLQDQDFATLNLILPPVLFSFSESPDVFLVSPRDRIELETSRLLDSGAPVAQMEEMESEVEATLNVSALVEGTGGLGAYPTMVLEYPDVEAVLSIVAHEWFHNYSVFQPLGWHYFDSPGLRTLNETAASIFGDELGRQALERFYPELAPPPAPPATPAPSGQARPPEPRFSFTATMRATRLRADELLREGRITEAESYMEEQRRLIVSHGYVLRKLNQAYFAFHGSYAVGPGATDPIGDALRLLRERSASLREFVRLVSGIRSVGDLDALLAPAAGASGP